MFHHTCTEVEQANEPVIFFVAMASLVVRPLDDVVSQGLGQIIHIHWALLKGCTRRANDRLCSEVCVFGQNVVTVTILSRNTVPENLPLRYAISKLLQ